MKKTSLLILLVTLGFCSFAQNLSVPKLGLKVGFNYSHLNFPQYNYLFLGTIKATEGYANPTKEFKPGVKAGVFLDIKLTADWYISPTLSYAQFGGTTKIDRIFDTDTIRTFGQETNSYKMDYITLDPILEYRATHRLSLNAGPSISYLLSNNINTVVSNHPIPGSEDYNGEILDVNEIDAGIHLGASFFMTENLDVNLNLYIGMMNLEKRNDGYNRFNQASNLSIGYIF